MYIPKHYLTTDRADMLAFMQRYSFALIVTAQDSCPVATHLPFIVTEKDGVVVLYTHFAKANKHWNQIDQQQILVIFSEPHAYISPSHYDNPISVPTWNYIAVHAYGQGQLITEEQEALSILEKTIDYYEANYRKQWSNLPNDYKMRMLKGIVACKIEITELQGKQKLSQNKNLEERQRIVATLEKSMDSNEQAIADYMRIKE